MTNQKIYNLYGFGMNFLGFEKSIFNFIKKLDLNCNSGAKILDIGCGTGIIGLSLMKKISKSTLIATDIDKSFLQQTINNAKMKNLDESKIFLGISDISLPKKNVH